ncbi:hypothetical protein [Streptomyces vinaceus]|uniref:hypothetical protein n=1 Tax=Streptomyces vinaceus TaxID=1960 RepID=UPI0037F6F79A
MTTAYNPDPTRPHLVPLGIDPATGTPVFLDWEKTPHLTIAAGPGMGTTSLIHLIAAHTVATGGTATIIDPHFVDPLGLDDVPGIDSAFEKDDIEDVIRSYVGELRDRFTAVRKGPELIAPRRVLAVDGLATLWHAAKEENDHRLLWALTDLKQILLAGRAVGVHLVTDIDAATVVQQLGAELVKSATGTLTIGRADHDLARLLGTDPLLARPAAGAAIWRTPADQGRQLDLAYVTAEQARQLVLATLPY